MCGIFLYDLLALALRTKAVCQVRNSKTFASIEVGSTNSPSLVAGKEIAKPIRATHAAEKQKKKKQSPSPGRDIRSSWSLDSIRWAC